MYGYRELSIWLTFPRLECLVPISHHLPWQVNVAAKVVLSRMPVSYRIWKKIGFFNLGSMEQPEYAFTVFARHFKWAGFSIERGRQREAFTCLELGPGDSLSSAVIATALGASQTFLVDVVPFAASDLAPYRKLAAYLSEQCFPIDDLSEVANMEQLLSFCSATYFTNGLASLRQIPSNSVDFVFSHSTLQQVRRADFSPIIRELRRIQRPNGAGSHSVSMRDLIGGGANDMRFSSQAWESPLLANSGFYTNRLRYSEMLSIFRDAGFATDVIHVGRWEKFPISRKGLAHEFLSLSDDDLRTYEWDVILR